MNRKHTKIIALIIIIAMVVTSMSFVFFLPGLWGATGYTVYAGTATEQKPLDQQMDQLEAYIEYIHNNYKDQVDYQDLVDGAFSGAIDALGDPYSVYYADKASSEAFEQDVTGQFGGIGVHINGSDGKCTVISAIRNTPADKAGIKTGDVIVKVGGSDVTELSLIEVSTLLKGNVGTTVKVTIDRAGKQMEFALVRELISTESVYYEMLEDDIGYISVSSFDADTDIEFKKAKIALVNKGAESVIIDVRNNPGGLVNTAVSLADEILSEGKITTLEKQGKTIQTYTATSTASLKLPIVLLVNEGSASASEILTGALKDNKAATVVGTTTYGKGIAQQIATLKSGDTLKLSFCYFLTPNGGDIHQVGIAPDYVVRNTTGADNEALVTEYNSFAPMSEQVKPKAGDTGLNVYGAQQRLAFLDFKVKVTGTMDAATVEAVKAFQKEEGLSPYGVLDYTTNNKLEVAAHDYAHGVSESDKQLEKAVELLKK